MSFNYEPGKDFEEQRSHERPKRDTLFKIRNTLNTLFIIGALVGAYFYMFADRITGGWILGTAMVLKFAESALRTLKR